MSKYNQNTNVPVAVKHRSQMDLSHITIASQDFGNIVPISCQYLVPGDEFNIKVSEFTRVLPMVNPTFAKVDSVVRAFVVPINYVWKRFNDFITGNKVLSTFGSSAAQDARVPYFTITHLRNYFTNTVNGAATTFETLDGSDFTIYDSSTHTNTYYKFTNKGRKVMKHLQGLGYNINISDEPFINAESAFNGINFSILPILAFIKVYFDWIVPSRFLTQYALVKSYLDGNFSYNDQSIGNVNLAILLNMTYESFLDNDYFTASWVNIASTPNQINNFVMQNPVDETYFDTYHNQGAGAENANSPDDSFNYYTIASLARLQSLINRNMIAGSKVKDWIKVTFGIDVNLDALQTSTYLGMFRNTMRISDIMSTADTADSGGSPLGSYAGRAGLGGDGEFSYKAKQHCFLFVTHEIIPKPLYFQGLRPQCTMLSRNDFFQPEYDNLGFHAISKAELFSGSERSFVAEVEQNWLSGIFGFAPQYANLKFGFDNVIGDFRCRSMDASMSSWFLGRKFHPSNIANLDNINLTFCKVNGTNQASYDDMFTYQGTDIDHFYCLFDIAIRANRPMVSINDALTLDEEMNDRKVSVSTNNNPNV